MTAVKILEVRWGHSYSHHRKAVSNCYSNYLHVLNVQVLCCLHYSLSDDEAVWSLHVCACGQRGVAGDQLVR